MSSRIRMGRTPRRGEKKRKEGTGEERIHVNLTIRRQVWTLARQKFPNVSRVVEKLLELALGLEPSLQMVVIPNWERAGSSVWESDGFASLRQLKKGEPLEAEKKIEPPLEEIIFSKALKPKEAKQPLLNYYWSKYKNEFIAYLESQVEEGKLSENWYKNLRNALISFFKKYKINEAFDFVSIQKDLTNPQIKALKKFFKFLMDFKYKEVDIKELEAMNRQLKVRQSPKLEGKPAKESEMKKYLDELKEKNDYSYYLYKALIYTGGRSSQIYKLLQDIGKGKVTEKDLLVFGDVGAFDITKYAEGKKPSYFAIMPLDFAKELLANKDLFKKMPKSFRNVKALKKASKLNVGASNIRDWFFNKALYQLEGNKTNINFIQSRQDEKGSWQNYSAIREALKGAVKEYKKLMEKGMFSFMD